MRKAGFALVGVLVFTGVAVAGDADFVEPFVISDSRVSPEYPPAALAAGFEGTVAVAAVVNSDGSVGAVEVVESSNPKLGFNEAAIDAMTQWRFSPARSNGEAVDSVYAYVFYFYTPRGPGSGSFVGGDFVTSEFVGGVGDVGTVGKPRPGRPALTSDRPLGNGTLIQTIRDKVQKVKLSPTCGGRPCLYDRRDLIPPRGTEYQGPNRTNPR
jgi:protein TonB